MLLFPKKTKFNKSFSSSKVMKKTVKVSKSKYSCLNLIALSSGKITNFQIESLRRFLRRFLKKKAQIFFRVFPAIPVTKKPNDVRLGRGKGAVKYWAAHVKRGDVILEIKSYDTALTAAILKASRIKLATKTFVFDRSKRWIF